MPTEVWVRCWKEEQGIKNTLPISTKGGTGFSLCMQCKVWSVKYGI